LPLLFLVLLLAQNRIATGWWRSGHEGSDN
jgi:hypothetical protein